jgi:hypothetical protein
MKNNEIIGGIVSLVGFGLLAVVEYLHKFIQI